MIYDYLKEHQIKDLSLGFRASLGWSRFTKIIEIYKDIGFGKVV